ncbi:ATP-binding protein [Caloranaerobacter ferrireducens]|uniref:ATP-binding protein n=1 Tax=Caloranaerobacter ferrireducens TaxID=1323370 RepID=UPI0009F3C865
MSLLRLLSKDINVILNTLLKSKANNSYRQKLKYYLTLNLLILNKLGFRKFNEHIVDLFYKISSKRYEKVSIIIASNKSFDELRSIFFYLILTLAY